MESFPSLDSTVTRTDPFPVFSFFITAATKLPLFFVSVSCSFVVSSETSSSEAELFVVADDSEGSLPPHPEQEESPAVRNSIATEHRIIRTSFVFFIKSPLFTEFFFFCVPHFPCSYIMTAETPVFLLYRELF